MTMYTRESLKENNRSWEDDHKLSIELYKKDPRLTRREYDTLIHAVKTNNPVEIIYNQGPLNRDGENYYSKITAIVEHFTVNESSNSANIIRVHYTGFGHYVWIGEIYSIKIPDLNLIKESELPEKSE